MKLTVAELVAGAIGILVLALVVTSISGFDVSVFFQNYFKSNIPKY